MAVEIIEAGFELLGAALELAFSWEWSDVERTTDPPPVLAVEDAAMARRIAKERNISHAAAVDLVAWLRAQRSP